VKKVKGVMLRDGMPYMVSGEAFLEAPFLLVPVFCTLICKSPVSVSK